MAERATVFDSWSGEAVGWDDPAAPEDQVRWEYVGAAHGMVRVRVTRRLTRDEAIEQYGEVTEEEFGPRGGWRSATFGTTKFLSKSLQRRPT